MSELSANTFRMRDVIFEKIIAREIPAEIFYEDDIVVAFLDIKPINIGHALIVPKRKFVNIFDGDTAVLEHMAGVAQRVACSLRTLTNCDGVNLLMNSGEAAGQEVFHAHMHVIPRFREDGAYLPAKHIAYDEVRGKEIATQLRTALERM